MWKSEQDNQYKAQESFNHVYNNISNPLDDISTFNINARYDNYKQDFHKLCKKEFAEIWSEHIENLRKWLIKGL